MTHSFETPLDLKLPGLDWTQLDTYLGSRGYSLDTSVEPRRFSAGYGNMNFLLKIDGEEVVLRRPPLGPVPPGANDMAREFRILSHLHDTLPLVPHAKLFCDDPKIIGARFFVMEYRPGLVIGDEIPSGILEKWISPTSIGQHLGGKIIDVLSELHAVDVDACGLGDLGRHEGFIARTLRGWSKRAQLSWVASTPPKLDELVEWLNAHPPVKSNAVSLIHNDFKLDNIILDPDTLMPRTLIDWDMGTLGDPQYDLAVLLSYWSEATDPEAMHQLRQMPTAGHGFPTREKAAELYAKAGGTELHNFTFYRVLATLRLAVVFQQLYCRYKTGGTDDTKFANFDNLALGLLNFGMDIARGRHF
ncbi:phosphotransferase family protein [Sulfitobacter sp. 1A13191]|uniref:phosphotransferase family protein n=1 Tax=Sulfitobacter sp. 1A13191 TaxID=3368589 RepID=UPI003746C47C